MTVTKALAIALVVIMVPWFLWAYWAPLGRWTGWF